MLRELASSGCVQLLVGIESLVFRYPGMGEKRAELSRITDAVEAIQQAGVAVNGCFIVGADGETNESLDRLARFILDSPLAEVQLTLQTPFPGTSLYRRLRREGRLLADRGWPHYTLFDVAFRPDRLTVAELEKGFQRVIGAVFCYLAMTAADQGNVADAQAKLKWGKIITIIGIVLGILAQIGYAVQYALAMMAH